MGSGRITYEGQQSYGMSSMEDLMERGSKRCDWQVIFGMFNSVETGRITKTPLFDSVANDQLPTGLES